MKTTYEKIRSFNPCYEGWKTLLANTNPEMNMQKEIDIMDILRSNGIKDAVWSLRCWDYMDWCLFICDVAESVLPIFENKYPKDDRPRKALQVIRDYKAGTISRRDLKNAAYAAAYDAAAYDAYAAVYNAAAYAAYAAYAADVAFAAYAAAAYVAYAAYAAAAYAAAVYQKKWDEIEQIFIKHFGGVK